MLSKFLAVFGYIVLYMVIWALLLLPVALLLRRGGGSGPLTALLVMTALIVNPARSGSPRVAGHL